MKLRVRLFAQLRLAASRDGEDLELPDGATLGEALDLFFGEHPELQAHRAACMTAVGLDYAPPQRVLRDGEEISLIPPVQGG